MDGKARAVRPFRFGTGTYEHQRGVVLEEAARAAGSGYDVFVVADHQGLPGPWPVLTLVADRFPGLRVGTYVLNNDLRNPVMMAKDAATLDLLSEGRLELGGAARGCGGQTGRYLEDI